jgi:hypothetical protein
LAFGIEHAGEFQFGIESTEIAEYSLDALFKSKR